MKKIALAVFGGLLIVAVAIALPSRRAYAAADCRPCAKAASVAACATCVQKNTGQPGQVWCRENQPVCAAPVYKAPEAGKEGWLNAAQVRAAVAGKTCDVANGNRITFGSLYTVKDRGGPTYSGPWRVVNQGIIVNFTEASGAAPSWRPHTKNFGIGRRNGSLYIGTVPMKCR